MTIYDTAMWREIIEVFSAVLVSMGGLELVKWLTTRRSSAKKAAAEADKAGTAAKLDEIQLLKDMILFIQSQMAELQEWLRREQAEHAADLGKCREIQAKYDDLERKYNELKRKYDELVNGV